MNIKNIYLFCTLFLTIPSSTSTIQKSRSENLATHRQQLENQLKNLKKQDKAAILRDFDQEMKSYTNDDLTNNNLIGQTKATILANYGKTKAELEAKKYSKDPNIINQFTEQWNTDIISKLSNNESIDGMFDKVLEKAAYNHFTSSQFQRQNAYYNGTPPVQPKPSAPPVEINNQYQFSNQPYPVYYVTSQNDKDRIAKGSKELGSIITSLSRANLSTTNITKFTIFFYESIKQNSSTPIIPSSSHVQNAFIKIFDNELDWLSIKLSQEISFPNLENAIQATRESLRSEIKKLTPQTAQRFQQILISLEDTIRNNAGIACPACTETYKEHDKFGSVEKIILEACQHAICKTCIKNPSIHTCPECRKAINKQNLYQQISKPDNPANWHP